jgi:glycosyltransferase involved in cell wall biosynthesis
VTLLYRDRGHPVDGIRDYTQKLELALLDANGLRISSNQHIAPGFSADLRGAGGLVLQYNPFSYARWGFAPWLPTELLALRRRRRRPRIGLMIHEPYVPMQGLKSSLMGAWQRAQLRALAISADVMFVSIESWAEQFRRWRPLRPVHHLPVGSNLPDMRGERASERSKLGVGPDELVIAGLGRDHPSWLGDHFLEAVRGAAAHQPTVLMLGADAPELPELQEVASVHRFGRLSEADLARKFAAADLFVAPLIDGVSTRRGTLMAALQHEVAVVGTDGHLTDSELRNTDALRLAPVKRPAQLGEEAARLAADAKERRSVAREGRLLYERSYDWPVISRRILEELARV